jgi:hypothetical protein
MNIPIKLEKIKKYQGGSAIITLNFPRTLKSKFLISQLIH